MSPFPFPAIDPEQTIPQRFAQVVAAWPERTAVRTTAHTLTYRALDAWADRFAAALEPAGARTPVAVAIGHDVLLAAALLGTLKAGRPYVCFDPVLPAARLHDLLDDAGAGALLTDGEAPPIDRTRFSGCLLDAAALPEAPPHPLPVAAMDPGAPAALYYTSGSTGTPKAVVRSHRTMLHNARTYAHTLCLTPDDRLTLLAPARVAASASPLFGALLHGACLLPFDVRRDGIDAMIRWMEDERITVYHSVPSLFRLYAETLPEGAHCPALRVVRLGGEAVYAADVALFKSRFAPPCVLVNGFSMTEAGGNICAYVVEHASRIEGVRVPIGVPVEGREVALVDADGAPVPDGAPGEMLVASPFLATGYWRDEARTAARFDAVPGDPPRRRLRTGELVRRLPDGNLEHVGRLDRQVKIRGFRVEPGEVEAVLRTHPGIREAAVVAYEHAPADLRLAAYLVATDAPLPATALRTFAQQRLPDYMVPAAFGWLDCLPRTHSGKIDYPSLPDRPTAEPGAPYEEPRTPLEHRLAALWAEILGCAPVSRHADFFDLGGHSLLAARLVSRVERDLGRTCTLGTLIQSPTPAALAEVLADTETAWTPLVALQTAGEHLPLFLVHGRGGHAQVLRTLALHLRPRQPVYGFEARGFDGKHPPFESVEAMAAFYVEATRAVQPAGPYYLGGFSFGGLVAYEMARQLQSCGAPVGLLVIIDTSPPHRLALQRHPLRYGGHTLWQGGMRLARRVFKRLRTRPRRSAGATEASGEPPLQRFREMRLANTRASRTYLPLPYDGPVLLIRAATSKSRKLPRWAVAGWSDVASDIREVYIEGLHRDLVEDPAARTVAQVIDAHLQAARAEG